MKRMLQKNALYIVLVLLVLIAALLTLLQSPVSEITEDELIISDVKKPIPDVDAQAKTNTIAQAWQWEAEPLSERANPSFETASNASESKVYAKSFPFTQASVYQALHAVNLDNNGDVILNNDALIALNATLDHPHINLDRDALEALQTLIRQGLPGNAGEQTAQLVADYYQYLGAKNEFNDLYETHAGYDQSIDSYETQYNELIALREVYLGEEAADHLFATADANSRYMFESMKIEANTTLSEAEKKLAQAKVIAEHESKTINVNNWSERYQAFSSEKQYIINSSISDTQKRQQLADLMRQHFTYEELEHVSHLQLDAL